MKGHLPDDQRSGIATDTVGRLAEKLTAACRSQAALSAGNGLIRVEVECEATDPLPWLAAQKGGPKVYWRGRDDRLEIAALGAAEICQPDRIEALRPILRKVYQVAATDSSAPRYYGGLPFGSEPRMEHDDGLWKTFGTGWFLLPRFELTRYQDYSRLACNVVGRELNGLVLDHILRQFDSLLLDTVGLDDAMGWPHSRRDLPSRQQWTNQIEHALGHVVSKRLHKIVLARRVSFEFDEQPDVWQILDNMRKQSLNCFLFGFQPSDESAFLGASPELLFRRDARNIKSEALAGTRPRGLVRGDAVNNEDTRLEQELLHSDKDRREHQCVVDSLRVSLDKLCSRLEADEQVTVRKLARVQHLATTFVGTLRPEVDDLELLAALHPTPAVSGFPEQLAIQEIARLESFNRGWYAGPVGWISGDASEFAVAIRSGLVHRDRLILYSGAGIVEGSTPEDEWQEIETKIESFLHSMTEL